MEASIVLPLFLFFFMSIGSFIEMIRLHGNIQLALWRTGNELAVYGCALEGGELSAEEGEDVWWEKLADAAFSSTFVKAQIVSMAGKEYLDASPLARGTDSLLLWESDVFGPGDEIDLVVTYSAEPCGGLMRFFPFRMANRCYAHIWNGYAIPGEEQKTETVFVAENAAVYHLDRNCTHLRLSVRRIPAEQLPLERNRYGKRYTMCEKCGGGDSEILYISPEGDRYHYRPDCSGLKRTVHTMLKEEAEALYPPCKRCGRE